MPGRADHRVRSADGNGDENGRERAAKREGERKKSENARASQSSFHRESKEKHEKMPARWLTGWLAGGIRIQPSVTKSTAASGSQVNCDGI